MKSFFPVTKKVVSCASKKRKAVADSAVEIEENTMNVVDIEGGAMDDANTNVEAADVDDIVVNEDDNGNDNQVLLTERLTVHNVVIDRTLEEGVPSQNVRVRSLPVLKNDGIFDSHDWLHQDIGSFDEMEKRYRENNSDAPNSRDDTAIKNDKTLILTKVNGRICLYCTVCKTHVNANKKVTRKHLLSGDGDNATRGHIFNMKNCKLEQSEDIRLAKALSSWMKKNNKIAGLTYVNYENSFFRMNCVYNMLRCGISLRSLDTMRIWLEEGFKRKLVDSSRLGTYIPSIVESELGLIQDLIDSCCECTVIVDGTTRVDEILCVIFRFVTKDFKITHKLVSLKRYDSCKNGEQLAQEVSKVIQNRYHLNPNQIISFQRDRAAANEKMMALIESTFPWSHNLHCLSHTITHVGEHIKSTDKLVDSVISLLQSMLNQNGGANKPRYRWRTVFGVDWSNPGNTRWWAKYELILFLREKWNLFLQFVKEVNAEDDVEEIVQYDDVANTRQDVKLKGKRILALRSIACNMFNKHYLKFEIDVISIVAEPLIDATYILESNGPNALVTFDIVENLLSHLKLYCESYEDYKSMPSKLKEATKECREALRRELSDELRERLTRQELNDSLVARAKLMTKGALKYFKKTTYGKRDSVLVSDMKLYRLCRYFDPIAFRGSMNDDNFKAFRELFDEIWDIRASDESRRSSVLKQVDLDGTRDQWVRYRVAVTSIDPNENDYNPKYRMHIAMLFWRNSTVHNIPATAKFARYCFCLVASSAAAERVFSTLKSGLSLVQLQKCIEELSEIAVMLQYNKSGDCEDTVWQKIEKVLVVVDDD